MVFSSDSKFPLFYVVISIDDKNKSFGKMNWTVFYKQKPWSSSALTSNWKLQLCSLMMLINHKFVVIIHADMFRGFHITLVPSTVADYLKKKSYTGGSPSLNSLCSYMVLGSYRNCRNLRCQNYFMKNIYRPLPPRMKDYYYWLVNWNAGKIHYNSVWIVFFFFQLIWYCDFLFYVPGCDL